MPRVTKGTLNGTPTSNPVPRSHEALLVHRDFVRRLAQRLLADGDRAEELEQDTWLSLLRRAPDASKVKRSWLATIVRNLSRNQARDAELRQRRETQAGIERQADALSTEHVAQCEAIRREVVEAVLTLAEPYRSTVLLVYFDGYSAAAVARQLEIPGATVRSRLKRGLACLRDQLDHEHGGDRRAWTVALAPWATPLPRLGLVAAVGSWLPLAIMQQKTPWVVGLLLALSTIAIWTGLPGATDDRGASGPSLAGGSATESTAAVAVEGTTAQHSPDLDRRALRSTTVQSPAEADAVKRNLDLQVQVVDARGFPVSGIPVVFGSAIGLELHPLLTISTTAPGGIAEFRGLQHAIGDGRGQLGVSFTTMRVPAPRLFTLDTWPDEMIRLELPAVGSIEIQLVDGSGQPWRLPAAARHDKLDIYTIKIDGEFVPFRSTSRGLQKGRARLFPVGLGLTFRAKLDHCSFASGSVDFNGPTAAGEDLLVELPVLLFPLIAGRLLAKNGRVLDSAGYKSELFYARSARKQHQGHSDGSGRFVVPVPRHDELDSILIEATIGRQDGDGVGERQLAVLDATQLTLAAGLNEVGDLRLGDIPLALAGVVRSSRGEPVVGATVKLQRSERGYIWWLGLAAKTDSKGRFEIRGYACDHGLFATVCAADGVASGRFPCRYGDPDAGLVLAPSGSVEADLLLDDWVSPRMLLVTWTEHANNARVGRSLRRVREGNRLRLANLRPGRFSLRIDAAGEPEHLFRLDDIAVQDGETLVLPTIDLRERLHRIRLHVVDQDGHALRDAKAMIAPDPGSTRRRLASRSATGMLDVLSLCADPAITVTAPGRCIVRVPRARDGQRVVLPIGHPLRLRIEVPELPANAILGVSVHPASGNRPNDGSIDLRNDSGTTVCRGSMQPLAVQEQNLTETSVIVLHVPEFGEYAARARVYTPGHIEPVQLQGAGSFVVDQHTRTQRFALSEDALRGALRDR